LLDSLLQEMGFLLLLLMCGTALAAPDKSEKAQAKTDSYNSPVGTSYTVPLTASYNAPVSKETRKYSVSADDLERADLSVSSSLTAPVFSSAYTAKTPQAPINSYLAPGASVQQAEARDGGGHGHHHAEHGHEEEHHHVEHAAAAAPVAAAAPEPAYQAPVSQGNLYYYYYPVQAEPIVEKSDDELDPLVLVLLPITILVGVLALISVINVSVTGRALHGVQGRAFPTTGRQNSLNAAFGSFEQLKAEVDRMLERYYHALENESCMDRVVCELGTKAKDLSGKNMLMTALDWIIPDHMTGRISTFKDAVNEGYEVHQCKQKFYCDSSKLIQTNRK